MSSVRNHAVLLVASAFSSYFLGSPLLQFIAKACSSIHCLVADGEFLVTKKTIFFSLLVIGGEIVVILIHSTFST